MTGIRGSHLATASATVDVLKAATAVLEAFPDATDLVVWGNPPVMIEGGLRVEHPELVGRPVAVYAKGDRYLWSDQGDMGHGELPGLDGLHELLRGADKALPWLVRAGHGGYWTILLQSIDKQLAGYASRGLAEKEEAAKRS